MEHPASCRHAGPVAASLHARGTQPDRQTGAAVSFLLNLATLIGLAIAIFQLTQTGRAVAETRRVVGAASRQNAVYTLLVVAPLLENVERRLTERITANDRAGVIIALIDWRNEGNDLLGLLRTQALPEAALETHLRESLIAVTLAKEKLREQADLVTTTRTVTTLIDAVCASTRASVSHIRALGPDISEPTTLLQELRAAYLPRKSKQSKLTKEVADVHSGN